jgi:hypothetical protein
LKNSLVLNVSHQHRLATLLRGFAGTQGEVTPDVLRSSLRIVGVPLNDDDVKRLLTTIDPKQSERRTADKLIQGTFLLFHP